MGSSTKKTTSNQTTNQATTNASNLTTTPNVADFAVSPVQNYFSALGDFGSNYKPDMLTTPANGLQQQSYTNAHFLPSGGSELGQASLFAQQAGNAAPANYNAPIIDPVTRAGNVNVNAASLGPAEQAALAQAQAAQAGPAASLLDGGLDKYMNPYLSNVVDTSLADFDANAGRVRAAGTNQLARLGAFGGSRAGIAQAATEGELARGRGALDAGLRSEGFNTAAGLANTDAGRRQETSLFNTGNQQQTNLANAGFENQTNQFNTGQSNQQNQYGAGLQNSANIAQAQIAAQIEQANAAAANQRASQQAGLDAQGGMFNVGTQQQALDRMLSAGGLLSNNAQTGSAIANNNLASQMAAGNNQWDIDRYNNGAPITAMQGFGSLVDPSLYSEFTGQNVNGYENGTLFGTGTGTETAKTSGGLLGSLGGLLSGAAGIGGLFKK